MVAISHKECGHPKTGAAREKCRRSRGLVSPSQTSEARKAAYRPRPRPERKSELGPEPTGEPKPPSEAQLEARRKRRGADLTVPRLSGMIYKRMKYNRHRQYVFSLEWLYRQYPGVAPEMIDAALQHLVDKGKISGIPK